MISLILTLLLIIAAVYGSTTHPTGDMEESATDGRDQGLSDFDIISTDEVRELSRVVEGEAPSPQRSRWTIFGVRDLGETESLPNNSSDEELETTTSTTHNEGSLDHVPADDSVVSDQDGSASSSSTVTPSEIALSLSIPPHDIADDLLLTDGNTLRRVPRSDDTPELEKSLVYDELFLTMLLVILSAIVIAYLTN